MAEYWLVDAETETLEQHVLRDGAHSLKLKSGSGTVRSRAAAGFEVSIRALFDPSENLAALRSLLDAGGSRA